MSVLGSGVDLVENDRMREVVGRWGDKFKEKVFLPGERDYCESKAGSHRHYAGRFAVKEAVAKAFGTGLGPHLGWGDIEVVRDKAGAPVAKLNGRARELARNRGVEKILISLAHMRNYAVAHALLLGKENT